MLSPRRILVLLFFFPIAIRGSLISDLTDTAVSAVPAAANLANSAVTSASSALSAAEKAAANLTNSAVTVASKAASAAEKVVANLTNSAVTVASSVVSAAVPIVGNLTNSAVTAASSVVSAAVPVVANLTNLTGTTFPSLTTSTTTKAATKTTTAPRSNTTTTTTSRTTRRTTTTSKPTEAPVLTTDPDTESDEESTAELAVTTPPSNAATVAATAATESTKAAAATTETDDGDSSESSSSIDSGASSSPQPPTATVNTCFAKLRAASQLSTNWYTSMDNVVKGARLDTLENMFINQSQLLCTVDESQAMTNFMNEFQEHVQISRKSLGLINEGEKGLLRMWESLKDIESERLFLLQKYAQLPPQEYAKLQTAFTDILNAYMNGQDTGAVGKLVLAMDPTEKARLESINPRTDQATFANTFLAVLQNGRQQFTQPEMQEAYTFAVNVFEHANDWTLPSLADG